MLARKYLNLFKFQRMLYYQNTSWGSPAYLVRKLACKVGSYPIVEILNQEMWKVKSILKSNSSCQLERGKLNETRFYALFYSPTTGVPLCELEGWNPTALVLWRNGFVLNYNCIYFVSWSFYFFRYVLSIFLIDTILKE